jgi:hypothetical protein
MTTRKLQKTADSRGATISSGTISGFSEIGTGTSDLLSTSGSPTNWKKESNETFSAPVALPSRTSMTVHLVPINLVNQLEEYQSDLNLTYFALGSIVGAIFAIVVNWVTSENFLITKISVFLLVILSILFFVAIFFLNRIRNREKKLKKDINDNKSDI